MGYMLESLSRVVIPASVGAVMIGTTFYIVNNVKGSIEVIAQTQAPLLQPPHEKLIHGALIICAVDHGIKVSMFWLFATYTLHTWGELCISPTGLAFVTRAAAVKYVSFLMGIYFLSNVVAGILGGSLAGKVEGIEKGTISLPWYPWFKLGGQADFFLMFVIATMGAGLVVLALTPLLKKLTKSIE